MRGPTTGRIALALVLAGTLAACGSDDDDGTDPADGPGDPVTGEGAAVPDGLAIVPSARGAAESIGAVETALAGNGAVNVLPIVNHGANAEGAGLELPPTELLLFGNPSLGSQLMAIEPMAGLDLPQKLLAWEDGDGTRIAYNRAEYVAARHGIEGADEALGGIADALAGLAMTAAGTTDGAGRGDGEEDGAEDDGTEDGTDGTDGADGADAPAAIEVTAGEGVLVQVSERPFQATYDALVAAIGSDANPLSVAAEIDHAAAAANVGVTLEPLRLVVFGNPAAGTPLMQASRTVGIDLPQKMLVFEEDGVVTIAWNDPAYLAERHGIEDQAERIETIAGALAGLAAGAAAAP